MAFKTFTVGEIATASDVNTYLMKQAVIVCTSATRPSSPVEGMTIYETDTDSLINYDGTGWRRYHTRPIAATVATSQTTASTTYTDLATTGPAVTLTTGEVAVVTLAAQWSNSGANLTAMSFDISGATTLGAADNRAMFDPTIAAKRGGVQILIGVTAGSNTFTAKYRVAAGTGTWLDRVIHVEAV